LGAILVQLPPSFTVNELKNIRQFLDRLPTAARYDYAIEFRQPSWVSESPWEMLEPLQYRGRYDWYSSSKNLQYLSDVIVTADHSFIRPDGRNKKGTTICTIKKNQC